MILKNIDKLVLVNKKLSEDVFDKFYLKPYIKTSEYKFIDKRHYDRFFILDIKIPEDKKIYELCKTETAIFGVTKDFHFVGRITEYNVLCKIADILFNSKDFLNNILYSKRVDNEISLEKIFMNDFHNEAFKDVECFQLNSRQKEFISNENKTAQINMVPELIQRNDHIFELNYGTSTDNIKDNSEMFNII
jgi:hypothetical protein